MHRSSVQPFPLLQRTIDLGRSILSYAWAKTNATSALQIPGSFVHTSSHLTATSSPLFPTPFSLKHVGNGIPSATAAWKSVGGQEEHLYHQCCTSIAHHGGARGWPGMLGWNERKQKVAKPPGIPYLRLPGGSCQNGTARTFQSASESKRSKRQNRMARHDHSSALTVVLGLVKKLQVSPEMSTEKVAETVNAELKVLWGNVTSQQFWTILQDSKLAPSLVLPVTAWAVSQPGWQYQQELYVNLIDYVGSQDDVQSTMWLCRLAVASGCELEHRFLTSAWRHLERWRLPNETLELLQAIGQRGVKVSHNLCTDLLKLYRTNRDLEGSLAALECMRQCGVALDVYHYTIVLEICGVTRNKDALETLVLEMGERGIKPSVVTYSTIMHCYALLNEPSCAREVFKEMLRSGFSPNIETYSVYHKILRRGGWRKDASKVLRLATSRKDVPKNATYYKLLLDEYTNRRKVKELLEMHTEMIGAGVTLDSKFYRGLFCRFQDLREAKAAHQVFWDVLDQNRVELNMGVHSVVVDTLSENGMEMEAEDVRKQGANRGWEEKRCENLGQLIDGKQFKEIKEALTKLQNERGTVPFSEYLMLMRVDRGWWEKDEIDTMLGVLDMCGYETTKMVRILLDTQKKDFEVWPRALKVLERMFQISGIEPCNFIVAVMTLLYHLGLYNRASRLWVESKSLGITFPTLNGFKLVKGKFQGSTAARDGDYELDLHGCTLEAAKVILSSELVLMKNVGSGHKYRYLQVVTGKGKNSRVVGQSEVQQGITKMLQHCCSPFVTNSKNSGILEASIRDVQEWLQHHQTKKDLELCGAEVSKGS